MRFSRRLLPPIVVASVVAGGALAQGARAEGAPALPAKTAAQLVAMVQRADVPALSGTVSTTSDLGLPALPSTGGSAGTSATDLLSGTHTARLWVDGPVRQRVQVLDQMAERDVVRNGRDVWTYTSQGNRATHTTLPARSATERRSGEEGTSTLTPQALAQRFLAQVGPSTRVSVGRTAQVAGRAAYELRLAPRSSSSLVGQVAVAVDARTGLPLRVRVVPRGRTSPAVTVAYTDLRVGRPAASRFAFRAPAGARVERKVVAARPEHTGRATAAERAQQRRALARARAQVVGHDWTSVWRVPAATAAQVTSNAAAASLLRSSGRPVQGGRLVTTALVNALVTDDGRIFVGAVTPAVLRAAARG